MKKVKISLAGKVNRFADGVFVINAGDIREISGEQWHELQKQSPNMFELVPDSATLKTGKKKEINNGSSTDN